MKIVAVVGSYRRGNTYKMVAEACSFLQKECDVKIFHLKDMNITPCCGCLKCDDAGVCCFSDSMTDIIQEMKEADAFIFGTPARWGLLSGEMKVFLDRLNPLAVPELLRGKKALVFAVGQSVPEQGESVRSARDSVVAFCENAGIEVVDTVLAFGCLRPEDIELNDPTALEKCRVSAKKLMTS